MTIIGGLIISIVAWTAAFFLNAYGFTSLSYEKVGTVASLLFFWGSVSDVVIPYVLYDLRGTFPGVVGFISNSTRNVSQPAQVHRSWFTGAESYVGAASSTQPILFFTEAGRAINFTLWAVAAAVSWLLGCFQLLSIGSMIGRIGKLFKLIHSPFRLLIFVILFTLAFSNWNKLVATMAENSRHAVSGDTRRVGIRHFAILFYITSLVLVLYDRFVMFQDFAMLGDVLFIYISWLAVLVFAFGVQLVRS